MAQHVIGITGGIGSGKTAATDRFAYHGITIVDADLAARIVVEPGRPALTRIAAHFGAHVIQADGSLDRRALRDIVFNDPEQRRWLEQLTHPLIGEELVAQLQACQSPYALLSSPLLLESGQSRLTQRILVIDVPEDIQLQRAMQRDDATESGIRAIMAAQMTRQERLAKADDVIDNSGDLTALHNQVDALHAVYLERSEQ